MPPFVLLKNPATYTPCGREDMLADRELREYWLEHFETHFAQTYVPQAIASYGAECRPRIEAALADLTRELRTLRARPNARGRLDLYILDLIRQEALHRHGVPDPFLALKQRENAAVIPQYRYVVDELDSHRDPREVLLLAVEGVFAGNIFDLGANGTAALFATASPDFIDVRDKITRPWLVDDFDAYAERVLSGRHKKAVFFLDNAGSDCILGVIPFVRHLAAGGTRVVIAANRQPALNDVTIDELRALLPQLAAIDPTLARLLASGAITTADSGSGAPLIDLGDLSEELNAASAGADIVYLEGMGRSVESNYSTEFAVDAVKMCMIKDLLAARRLGGNLFDTVLKFEGV